MHRLTLCHQIQLWHGTICTPSSSPAAPKAPSSTEASPPWKWARPLQIYQHPNHRPPQVLLRQHRTPHPLRSLFSTLLQAHYSDILALIFHPLGHFVSVSNEHTTPFLGAHWQRLFRLRHARTMRLTTTTAYSRCLASAAPPLPQAPVPALERGGIRLRPWAACPYTARGFQAPLTSADNHNGTHTCVWHTYPRSRRFPSG